MKLKIVFVVLSYFIFKTEAQPSVLKIADSLLQTGNYTSALAKLKSHKNPSFAEFSKIGSIYQKVNNYSKAIQFYDKAYNIQPSDKVKVAIGKCYQALGNAAKAIEIYTEALEANPNNLLLKYQLAKLYMGNRQTKKAITILEELIAVDKENPNYHYQLGEAFNKLKKDPSKHYLKAHQIDTTHVKSIYELAKFFKTAKVRDSSELFITKGLQLYPKSLNFLQLKAQNEYAKKAYDSTLVCLNKLEKLNFVTPFTLNLFGLSYFKLKEYEKALDYFKKASKRDPLNGTIDYTMGLTYFELKDYKKAQYSFLISVYKEQPNLADRYYHLAKSQIKLKQPVSAIRTLEKGLIITPYSANLLYELAILTDNYYKDKKIALKHYEKFVYKHADTEKEKVAFVKQRIKEIKKALFIKAEGAD